MDDQGGKNSYLVEGRVRARDERIFSHGLSGSNPHVLIRDKGLLIHLLHCVGPTLRKSYTVM